MKKINQKFETNGRKIFPLLLAFGLGMIVVGMFWIIKSGGPAAMPEETLAPSESEPADEAAEEIDELASLQLEMLPKGWQGFVGDLGGYVSPYPIPSGYYPTPPGYTCKSDTVDIYYFPPDQELIVPSLLSNYSFISIQNNHRGKFRFAEEFYGLLGSFENEQFSGKFYGDGKGGVWFQAGFTRESLEEVGEWSQLIVHAPSEEEVKQLLAEAGPIVVDPFAPSLEMVVPKRKTFKPNATDPSGEYRYYLPSGYIRQPKEEGWDWSDWKKASGEKLCLALEGINSEPCQFSTSGCTCCNTGCELLDLVLFMSRDGSLEVSELLQKGVRSSMGPRFVYKAEHPWIYWSASFSADRNGLSENVLDLIYMVNSLERTY